MPEQAPNLEVVPDERRRAHTLADGSVLFDQGITTVLDSAGEFLDRRNDAIHHVAKHFLNREERWETLLGNQDPDRPVEVRRRLGVRERGLLPIESDPSFWRPPRRNELLAVFRRAYFPAILAGIARAGLGPGGAARGPSARWVEVEHFVVGYVPDGICVKVAREDASSFEFVTAFRKSPGLPVKHQGNPKKAWNAVFEQKARQWFLTQRQRSAGTGGAQ